MISRTSWMGTGLALMLVMAGCKSAQEKANEAAITQAKQQAASTGTAQQVVATDADGSTTTTVVQPQAAGQATQQITTTKTTRTTSNATAANPAVSAVEPTSNVVQPVAPASQAAFNGDRTVPLEAARPVSAGQPAIAGGAPVVSPVDVRVARGTNLAIRINQHISVKTSHAGDRFSGEVVNPISAEGSDRIVIPKGTAVGGVIDAAHRRGHFKGRSTLGLRLTSMELNGQQYALDTRDNVRTKKGKGKRSAAFIGGGTGLGMLVGGLATGGVGLVVGGLAGAGAGTGIAGLTGNRDIEIPAESVINFRLANDLVVQPR